MNTESKAKRAGVSLYLLAVAIALAALRWLITTHSLVAAGQGHTYTRSYAVASCLLAPGFVAAFYLIPSGNRTMNHYLKALIVVSLVVFVIGFGRTR
jgi:hypothetical protein